MRARNRTVAALAAALLSSAALLACHQKETRVPFIVPQTPMAIVRGPTVVLYTVANRRGAASIVSFGFSTDGGLSFKAATPVQGSPPANFVEANPAGTPSFFYWDSFHDLGPGFRRDVILAPTADGGAQAITLPFVSDETDSFVLPAGSQGMARSNVLATPLPDDSVYIVGGTQAGQPVGFGEVYDPVGDQVLPVAVGGLSVVRSGFAGALLSSGRVLTAGGVDSSGNPLGNAEYFTKATLATRAVPGGLVVPRQDPALAPIGNGGAVVAGGLGAGGVPTSSIEVYDPTIGPDGGFAFVLTSTLAAVRLPTATPLADGRVLFAGGADVNGNAVATAFVFDPVARTVVPTSSVMSFARVGHRATRLSNGTVLLAGGEAVLGNPGSAQTTCEVFDPTTLGFTQTGGMNQPRAFHGQDLAGGRVLAVGGQGTGAIPPASTAESFNQDQGVWFPTQFPVVSSRPDAQVVATGGALALVAGGEAPPEIHFPFNPPGPETWTTAIARTQSARADHTATLYPSGDVLIAGGTSGITSATNAVEMFHPFALSIPVSRQPDTFEVKASMLTARAGHVAQLLGDGRCVVFGGRDQNGNVLGSIEFYDFFLDRWTALPATLAVPRTDARAVLLGDGDVLIVGGRDANGNPVGQAELFHPATSTVTSTGALATARADFDLFSNGFVIVAGGSDATGAPLSSIEVYNPVTGVFQPGGNLQVPRAGLALAQSIGTPQIVATGGNDTNGTRSDLEAIDLSTGLPAPVPGFAPLDVPRSFHLANLLRDTSVLLTGGKQNQLVTDASSLYFLTVPAPFGYNALSSTVRATITPHMGTPRVKHTATLLNDGRVLVVGGFDARGVAISGAEFFYAPAEIILSLTPQVFSVPGPQGVFR